MKAAYYLGRGGLLSSASDHLFIAHDGAEHSLSDPPLCDYQFMDTVFLSPYCTLDEALNPFTSERILELDALCHGNLICRNCLRVLNSQELLSKKLLQVKLDRALEPI